MKLFGKVVVHFNKDDKEKSIGEKRNELIDGSKSKYFAFIDDDDRISDNYIKLIHEAALSDMDCASLIGHYYLDGLFDRPFIHSIKYNDWFSDSQYHYRCPNHLNLIKREKVEDIRFNHLNFGEDGQWSMQICKENRLKTEYEINEVLYHYLHRSQK